jgi:hypothetical protein
MSSLNSLIGGSAILIVAVVVLSGCSSSSTLPEAKQKIIASDRTAEPFTLRVGEKARVEELGATIGFEDLNGGSEIPSNDSLTTNAFVVLGISQGDSLSHLAIRAGGITQAAKTCSPMEGKLSAWLICLTKLRRVDGTFEIVLGLTQYRSN